MLGYYEVKNYLDLAFHPVESAMTNGDDLVHLLVRLGASVNTIPKTIAESTYYKSKISLKDWIDNEIDKLDARIKSSDGPVMLPCKTPPECSGWEKFYREHHKSLKTLTEEEMRRQVLDSERKETERVEKLEKLMDAKAYFVDVKQLFESHGAKNLGKLSEDETSRWRYSPGSIAPNPSYKFLSNLRGSLDVPQHLISSYDQLFEACYVGDHEKIQSLCLPAEATKPGSILLNISVKMVDSSDGIFNGKRLLKAP